MENIRNIDDNDFFAEESDLQSSIQQFIWKINSSISDFQHTISLLIKKHDYKKVVELINFEIFQQSNDSIIENLNNLLDIYYRIWIKTLIQNKDYLKVIEIYEILLDREVNNVINQTTRNNSISTQKIPLTSIITRNTVKSEDAIFYKSKLEEFYNLYLESIKDDKQKYTSFCKKKLDEELKRIKKIFPEESIESLNTRNAIFWKNKLSIIN